MALSIPADERRRGLRRMKVFATGLLVLAAVVFIVCVVVGHGHGAWGYVQAMAEAAMVGGLADWFAVTALFRYPLGIPIPHTAIIPRKKDQIGASLGTFVQQNFLNEQVVGERIAAAELPRHLGVWLANPQHADRLAGEAASAVGGLAGVLRDDEVRAAVASFADKRLRSVQVAPLLARVIEAFCDSGQNQVVLSAALRGLMRFLDDNRNLFRQRLTEESPEWVPNWVDERLFNRIFTGVQSFLADVTVDDGHDLRKQFDARLRDYAEQLRNDPAKAARVEAAKLQILDHPDIRAWTASLWVHVKAALLADAADPESDLRRTVKSVAMQVGRALRDDDELRGKVDRFLQRLVHQIVSRYGSDIAALISSTVEHWDTAETSRRLELQVGRDLQFIRVNGTVVGSIVGLLIYTVSRLL